MRKKTIARVFAATLCASIFSVSSAFSAEQDSSPSPAKSDSEAAIVDEIGGPSTTELAGLTLQYKYTTGREYRIWFTEDEITFLMVNAVEPDAKPKSLPYRARKLGDEMYLVHWLVPGRVGHISLVADLKNKKMHVAGLMPGKIEFFDIADIHTIERK